MDQGRLRSKAPMSYEISSDSDEPTASATTESNFGTPEKPVRIRKPKVISIDEESDTDQTQSPVKSPPPRISTRGHSLRSRDELHLSLRAQENGDKPRRKKKHGTLPARKSHSKPKMPKTAQPKTGRAEIREIIATETAAKRNNFFIARKQLFLPLLPERNFVSKLLEQRRVARQDRDAVTEANNFQTLQHPADDEDLSVPYEELKQQPKGVNADMKPYQLSGLSFLVYLHRNGLSGILGDEMGLGKTLQTLALIQHLKETRKQRISSESQSRRWTPDLKILRFHGPVHERDRLKRIATGEIDMYGNETKRHKIKKRDRMTKAGKPIIDLDSEPETSNEIGVDLVVTTYETFQAEQSWFKRAFIWNYAILDEGHKIKNDQSLIAKALQALSAEYRLILTGTPIHNNLVELWALLHWLYPEMFTESTAESFKTSFNLAKGTVSTGFMDSARRLLEQIMLRRMKSSVEVNLNLPPKTEVLLYVPLTPMQRFWYQRLMTRADKGLLEELFQNAQQKEATAMAEEEEAAGLQKWEGKKVVDLEALEGMGSEAAWQESKEILQQSLEKEQQDSGKDTAWRKLMNLLMQLRKVCNHPYLLPHAEPSPYYIGEHIMHASGKFIVLDKIIGELVLKQKKKVLIFSGFTRMLDCCQDFLDLRGGGGENFRYLRLEGSTSRARRNLCIRLFNEQGSEHRVMLISTRAGGLGINLTAASNVIMMDQDWNPQIMLQAEARAHRIGQTEPVTVYKLCTQGTVEEQMLGRIQKKLYLSAKVTESMQNIHGARTSKKGQGGRAVAADEDMPQLSTTQLMSLVRRGARALTHPELDINDMLQWDWPTMLSRCKDTPADSQIAKDTGALTNASDEDEKAWLAQVEQVHSRVFEGKKYSKQKDDNRSIANEWSRADRRVGKQTTVMVDGFAISKESMSCGNWEAVPTLAGKNTSLATPKRAKKDPINNQEQCQVCWDGIGDLLSCSGCPRSYHYDCLDPSAKKNADAGGMIYRCRWCDKGFCEDCLDFDNTKLLGDNLKEYELLNYPPVAQAYYIQCPCCTDHHLSNPEERDFCMRQTKEIDEKHRIMLEEIAAEEALTTTAEDKPGCTPSDVNSLTDASTIDESAIATPVVGAEIDTSSARKKRKAAPINFQTESLTIADRKKKRESSLRLRMSTPQPDAAPS
ncbi:MAG: hypothetical protein Q9174_001660 [Haloplaca sp. 1 TL-2023]